MHTRKIGSFEVSAIGLGCMNMSMGYGVADDKESDRLLRECLDYGYTFLDTAAMYGDGHNETIIGKALKHRRNDYTLATKCGIYKNDTGVTAMNGRPESIRKECEGSLRRLQTDVIDLYYLHRVDPNVPVEDSIGTMSELLNEGKVRTLGLSEVSTETLRRAHAVHPITALQSEYSLWSRTPERKILAECKTLGIAFVPFSPLARAFLTGKCGDVTSVSEDNLRATIARPRFEPDAFAHNVKRLQPYGEIAKEAGCTMAQLALAWLLARGDKDMIPIPGTKHIEYMKENAGACEVELSDDVVQRLDELINEETIIGRRYTDKLMAAADSEKD